MEKLDYKKAFKSLYLPGKQPVQVEVPEMKFIMIDGIGSPQGKAYQDAIQALYSLTFTIKMSKLSAEKPEGYFEYVVPPLEGLWHCEDGPLDFHRPKEDWRWTSMIRQPDFVTEDVFLWAVEACRKKDPALDVSGARLHSFCEGLCVQMMHIGPYSRETCSIEAMRTFLATEGLTDDSGTVRRHHEIYLSNPRRSAPEKLRTVLRIPVK